MLIQVELSPSSICDPQSDSFCEWISQSLNQRQIKDKSSLLKQSLTDKIQLILFSTSFFMEYFRSWAFHFLCGFELPMGLVPEWTSCNDFLRAN